MVTDNSDHFLVRYWPSPESPHIKYVNTVAYLKEADIPYDGFTAEFLYQRPDMLGAPIPQRPNWKWVVTRESHVERIKADLDG